MGLNMRIILIIDYIDFTSQYDFLDHRKPYVLNYRTKSVNFPIRTAQILKAPSKILFEQLKKTRSLEKSNKTALIIQETILLKIDRTAKHFQESERLFEKITPMAALDYPGDVIKTFNYPNN